MFPTVAVTLGMSLLSPSDRYVRFWELDHPALKTPPVIGPDRVVIVSEEDQLFAIEDDLRKLKKDIEEHITEMERLGVDAEKVRKTKEELNKLLESQRRRKEAFEERMRDK